MLRLHVSIRILGLSSYQLFSSSIYLTVDAHTSLAWLADARYNLGHTQNSSLPAPQREKERLGLGSSGRGHALFFALYGSFDRNRDRRRVHAVLFI